MTLSNSIEPTVVSLQEDIGALKRDVTRLVSHLQSGAVNTAQSAVAQLDDRAQRLYKNLSATGGQSVKSIGRGIEKKPVIAILVALGIGYLGGRLLSR